jgi:hypothetical protein
MRATGIIALLLLLAATTAGCRDEQELRQGCTVSPDGGLVEGEACPPCKSSSDCEVVGNSCHEVGYCAPKGADISTTQEGCARPYEVPGDDACACVERNCVPKN